jgi:hypothetical protein
MLIRATRQVCFVVLPNGLTLELVYAPTLTGEAPRTRPKTPNSAATRPEASYGVWLMGERVLTEVRAGQA